jgi:hypothetical protein
MSDAREEAAMDEPRDRDDGSRTHEDDTGEQVGLGRVVEDHRPAGDREAERPDEPADEVDEASEDSFPASDPPPFTSASGG